MSKSSVITSMKIEWGLCNGMDVIASCHCTQHSMFCFTLSAKKHHLPILLLDFTWISVIQSGPLHGQASKCCSYVSADKQFSKLIGKWVVPSC